MEQNTFVGCYQPDKRELEIAPRGRHLSYDRGRRSPPPSIAQCTRYHSHSDQVLKVLEEKHGLLVEISNSS